MGGNAEHLFLNFYLIARSYLYGNVKTEFNNVIKLFWGQYD